MTYLELIIKWLPLLPSIFNGVSCVFHPAQLVCTQTINQQLHFSMMWFSFNISNREDTVSNETVTYSITHLVPSYCLLHNLQRRWSIKRNYQGFMKSHWTKHKDSETWRRICKPTICKHKLHFLSWDLYVLTQWCRHKSPYVYVGVPTYHSFSVTFNSSTCHFWEWSCLFHKYEHTCTEDAPDQGNLLFQPTLQRERLVGYCLHCWLLLKSTVMSLKYSKGNELQQQLK